jgi:Ca-activated chloride channel homolog
MHISQPLWLLVILAGVPLLYWSYRSSDRGRAALLGVFAAARLIRQLTHSVSPRRVWLKRIAMTAAAACVCLALARPQGGYTTQTMPLKGLDILVAIDTSKSMLTPDVKPNRLTRAKLAAEDLLGQLHGDGIGLIAFAGDAFLQSPVTTDYDAFRDSVQALDTNIIPRGGTNIASAIRLAQATFAARKGSDRILILMTDGEDLDAHGVAAARAAARQGLKIFTVGVGTTSGDLIPVPDGTGGTQYLRDSNGQPVRSRLDETTLRQLAQVTGGMYEPLGNQGQGLSIIYSQGLASFARHDLPAQSFRSYTEWFQWPLLAGILFLIVESMLLTRRRQSAERGVKQDERSKGRFAARVAAAAPALMAMGFGIIALPGTAHASATDAEKAYLRGDYARATREYEASAHKRPDEAKLQFDVGAAAYKSGDLGTATAAFQSAIKTGEPALQESAYYNLGNTEYRIGQHSQQAQPQSTIERWRAALKSYQIALQMRPGDVDAQYNHDLVQRRLAQLQQEQKSQPQNGSGGQQGKPSNGGKPSQNSSGQGQSADKGSKQGQQRGESQGQSRDSTQGQGQSPSQPQGQGKGQGQNQPQGQGKGQDQSQLQGQGQGQGQNQPQGQGQGQGQSQNQAPGQQPSQGNTQNDGQPPTLSPAARSAGAPPRSGQPVAANGTSARNTAIQATAGAAGADPDRLTQEEARQLLDSLKDDQHWLPPSPLQANSASDANTSLKDW